jgi:two-component system, OmpR family, response regulator
MAGTLLLVEDEPNIAEALGFILRRDGWSVVHLAEGSGAVAAARDLPADVVILDQMLPGPSGLDVLAELRADAATAATPVLVLTARGQPRDRDLALRAGADGHMTKPFSNAEIIACVRALTRRAAEP